MNKRLQRTGRWLLALFTLLLISCSAWAEQDAALEARMGYDGTIFLGRWYPLEVTITGGDEALSGRIYTDVNMNYEYRDRYEWPVSVQAGETRTFHIPLRAATVQRTLQVKLDAGGKVMTKSVTALRLIDSEALVIGVLGGDDALIRALCAVERRDVHGQREIVHAVRLEAENAARDERELNAFDALVMDGFDEALLTDAQREMMKRYAIGGGIIIRREKSGADAENAQENGSGGTPEMEAALIMSEIALKQGAMGSGGRQGANARYGTSLNEAMRVDGGASLWAMLVLLCAYVLLGGAGLYLYMKRMDRSKELWLALPLLAAAAAGLVVLGGYAAGQYQPMHTSVHITHYDEENNLYTEELVSLTAAGQTDIHVRTENGLPVERRQMGYFNAAGDDGERELRDVVSLGSQPGILLHGEATWLVRSLVVKNDAAPTGEIEASAWIEEDGLHAVIENQTDTDVRSAVFVTELGYASIGDLPAGGRAELLLARQPGVRVDGDGNQPITESTMLPFAESEYNVLSAYIDPERAENPDFLRSSLRRSEQARRNLQQSKAELVANSWGTGFTAMLIGETPDIACEPLYIQGKPASRSAQCSLLAREIRIELEAEDGWYYRPSGAFKAMSARADADGRPHLGEALETGYVENTDDLIIGYRLDGVSRETVREIRVQTMKYSSVMKEVTLEVYDHAAGKWTDAGKGSRVVIGAGLAQRAVSEDGELFIRYRNESEVRYEQLNLPSITIEGRKNEAQEGSEAV